jgi:beta-lactamase regulating signal transducer with metallopeptidase domain
MLSDALPRAVGLALVHFVWQGLLLGGLLAASLAALRRHSPAARYLTCAVGMLAMLLTPVVSTALLLADVAGGTAAHAGVGALLRLPRPLLASSSPLLPWITWLWLAGASALQLRMVAGWLWLARVRRTARFSLPAEWTDELRRLQERMRLRRAVRLAESRLVRVPCVTGWVRPLILLPLGVTTGMTPAQLRGILAHELAHIRRNDFPVNVVLSVFESLLFFHPVTWWLSRRLRTEREYCCDDVALTLTDDAVAYARALVRLDEIRSWPAEPVLSSTGGSLMRRITRIFERETAAGRPVHRWFPAAFAVLGVTALVAMAATGCLGDRDAGPAEAVAGPGALPGSTAPADQEALLADVTSRIEACRASGRLTPEVADAVLAQIAAGNVTFGSASCGGQEGMMATITCSPGDCGVPAEGCTPCPPGDCGAMGCDPADMASADGDAKCVLKVMTVASDTSF